jgi:hypothetical protein
VELSKAQDVEAGDGTTSVVVLAGSLLREAEQLLNKGIHPTQVSEGFQYATTRAVAYLEEISHKVELRDRDALLKSATTSLNSKVRPRDLCGLPPATAQGLIALCVCVCVGGGGCGHRWSRSTRACWPPLPSMR